MTSSDWIALAAVVMSGLVAIAGVVGQVVEARNRQTHEREMVREERFQRRGESAYIELLVLISSVDATLSRAQADLAAGGEPDVDDLYLIDARAAATATAFMSDEVQAAMRAWGDALRDVALAVDDLDELAIVLERTRSRAGDVREAVRIELRS